MKKLKILLSKILGGQLFAKLIKVKSIFHERLYRKSLMQSRNKFYGSFIGKNDLCFDVGANIGNRTESLLALGAKVVAIEPQQQCINILKKKFGNTITIVPKGLGAQKGKLDMYIATNSTISSFSKNWIDQVKQDRFSEYDWNKTEQVELTTLDELITDYGKPHFIKIDVEGFEVEVLKGLSSPVKYLSIEYSVPDNLEAAIECLEKLSILNSTAICNYSVGESMLWALNEWMSIKEFTNFIQTKEFTHTSFGDIYIMS